MAHEYKDAAKKSQDKKLEGYGGKKKENDHWSGLKDLNTSEQAGLKVIDKEPELSKETAPRIMRKSGGAVKGAMSLKRLDKAPRGKKPVMGGTRVGAIPSPQKEQEKFDENMKGATERKAGGKVPHMEWEHSKKDLEQDKKLAKKHNMPMEKWEKSALDKKHDEQQSTEGLKKGGRAKRASGGGLGMSDDDHDTKSHGKKSASKTTVNIIVGGAPGAQAPAGAPAPMMGPGGLPPMAPPPAPPAGPAMPPPGAMPPPAGGPPPQLPPGMMMRKDGGKVQVPYKKPGRKGDYPAMDFGSGNGFGRKQKIDAYGDK